MGIPLNGIFRPVLEIGNPTMSIFQGLLFLAFGMGLLIVDYQILSRGWLPCGSNGFKGRLEFHRQDQPGAFWSMFALYLLAGVALLLYAIGLLAGLASPLPLR
ncbi:MAG: hypothetical protein HUU13_10995 [Burkholderiaceae bacterium]|nr:hypothetical protein [Burkholderiaceae bacterium]